MNDSHHASSHEPSIDPAVASQTAAGVDQYVREHPGSSLLILAGLGVIAALAIRALNPPPPRNRAVRLLEDIHERLSELASHGYHKMAGLAEDGAHAASNGLGSLHIDRKLHKVGRQLKSLFR